MSDVETAAERVMRAMRALDAHRHDVAPTLEREYQRALEAYFLATQSALATDDVQGDDEDDLAARAGELRASHASIEAHYAAARHALRLARAYRREPSTSHTRERECIEAVQRHRDAVHALRLKMRAPAEQLPLPGLAKTRAPVREVRRDAKVG